ncbi:aspartate/glutamate racemase family protein [Streptomyces sp. NPDC001599]|uniref:aspartate/glutamate racemase family protein n=1 Tax=Streptomyces sp. NPDC001599 TaxID=3364591 RepID=UPI0036CACFB0
MPDRCHAAGSLPTPSASVCSTDGRTSLAAASRAALRASVRVSARPPGLWRGLPMPAGRRLRARRAQLPRARRAHGVITVLPNVLGMPHGLVRRCGQTGRAGPIRVVDIPVLDLDPGDRLIEALAEQARAAVAAREADVIVLGCTGMPGVAAALQERPAAEGPLVPVVDPTGAAIMWLESQVRLGVRPSRTTCLPPRPKGRIA